MGHQDHGQFDAFSPKLEAALNDDPLKKDPET